MNWHAERLYLGRRFVAKTFFVLGISGVCIDAQANEVSDLPQGFAYETTDAGRYIQLQNHKSLYWNEREFAAGDATCLDDCEVVWPPVTAPADAVPIGDWSIATRPDGSLQWSYKGKLLYTNVNDTFPNARLGADTAWNVLFEYTELPAGMTVQNTLLGRVLADHQGRTLYTMKISGGAENQSDAGTSSLWRPFNAPWLANGKRDWTIAVLSDGTRQWFYKGEGLYLYEKDKDPQDTYGHQQDGVWSAVILEPPSGRPPWVTVQQVGVGRVYADQDGKTLYAPMLVNSLDGVNTCLEECMRENWRPLLAASEDVSIGSWVIIDNEDGERQWSYNKRLLYTHTNDDGPGQMNGDGFGIGYKLFGGWRVIPVDSGILPSGS